MNYRMTLPPDVTRLATTEERDVFVDEHGSFVVLLIEGTVVGHDNRHGTFRKFGSLELARAYLLGLSDARQALDNLIFPSNPRDWFLGDKEG